jgi:protein-L-isoaspartate(D-aspartate) O-methyltransferase
VTGLRDLLCAALTATIFIGCPPHETSSSKMKGETAGVSELRKTRNDELTKALSERHAERDAMIREQLAARDVKSEAVLSAMGRVPRHRFVSSSQSARAYQDSPQPIVGKQTISQPYIVGFMTQAANIAPTDRCLEVGTGSGYQAAVLSELCQEVYSIEYLPEVAAFGRRNLKDLGYLDQKLKLRVGDGFGGWPDAAPFDAILVTAAPEQVPAPLLAQLSVGGRLVIPVGPEAGDQELLVWTRMKPGNAVESFEKRSLFGVRFVPFLGQGAD